MFCVGGVPIRPGTLLVPRVRCEIKKLRTLQKAISVVMAGAEGIEVAPRKHSRTACLERGALLLVFSPHRHTCICHRQRCTDSPRHSPRASGSL